MGRSSWILRWARCNLEDPYICKREAEEEAGVRVEAARGTMKMGEGATSQGMRVASTNYKSRKTDSPLEPPEGTQPSNTLMF